MQTPRGLLCPVCHMALGSSERQGIAIASCFHCGGAWLGRETLDKLFAEAPQVAAEARQHGRIREDAQAPSSSDAGPRRRKWRGALFDVE